MRKNYTSISVLRLFSTLMIFIFHYLISFTVFGKKYFPMYFVVQVFLFISGFLYGDKPIVNAGQFYKKNFAKILIPALVTLLLMATGYLIFMLCGITLPITKDGNNGAVLITFGHFWFVYAILLCYLITPAIHKIHEYHVNGAGNPKTVQILQIIIAVLIIINFFISALGEQLMILSYLAGFSFRKIKGCEKFNHNKPTFVVVGAIAFLSSAIACYLLSVTVFTPAFSLIREVLCMILGVSLCVIVLSLTDAKVKEKQSSILKFSDKYSYTFFLTHQFFLIAGFAPLIENLPLEMFLAISFALSILTAVIVDLITQPITILILKTNKKASIRIVDEKGEKVA